jgi:hypothetical protein
MSFFAIVFEFDVYENLCLRINVFLSDFSGSVNRVCFQVESAADDHPSVFLAGDQCAVLVHGVGGSGSGIQWVGCQVDDQLF